jgi:hypothetical protein
MAMSMWGYSSPSPACRWATTAFFLSKVLKLAFVLSVSSFWSSSTGIFCQAIPIGFEDQDVARISQLVDIAFSRHPVGNAPLAYGVSKEGLVYVITNFAGDGEVANVQQVLDLRDSTCDDGERGYVSMLLSLLLSFSSSFLPSSRPH